MAEYLFRRSVQCVIILLIISILVFGLIHAIPGGIMSAYEENPDLNAEDIARIRANYGLDEPLTQQYLKWLGNLLKGDWGNSFSSHRPALKEIEDRLPNTLLLMGTAFLLTLAIAIPLGIISALKQYSLLDHLTTTLAFAGQSLPVFWFGLLLIMVFHVFLRTADGKPLLPGAGMITPGEPLTLLDLVRHLILPVVMLALVSTPSYLRYMRSSMLDVVNQDYIRAARARGVAKPRLIYRHALRNALAPVVTLIALDLPHLFGGALFTETVFSLPGMGRLFYDAAVKLDYPVLMALLIISSALIIIFSLMADVVYTILDPRVKLR